MEFYQQCANYETWHPRTLKGYWWKVLYFLLPAYLQKKVQRVQNVATSFVINRYCTENDVLKLGWLSTLERTQLHLLRNIHQAIYSKTFWPEYIALEIYIPGRNLWSSVAPWLTISTSKRNIPRVISWRQFIYGRGEKLLRSKASLCIE